MQQIEVFKNRTNIVPCSLGFNVSGDTFESQIRAEPNPESELIAEWEVTFKEGSDGSDGELILTLDDSITSEITQSIGYMDLKRITGGEPLAVFGEPLQVVFIDLPTA